LFVREPAAEEAQRIHSGVMKRRVVAPTPAPPAKPSEVPTLPPAPMTDAEAAMAAERPRPTPLSRATTDIVVADLRKDPRSEE